MKLVFLSMIAFLVLVLLLLIQQHNFPQGFEPSVCHCDILRPQFLQVKEPKELFIAAQVCTKHGALCFPP